MSASLPASPGAPGDDHARIRPAPDMHTETAATRDVARPVSGAEENAEALRDAPVFHLLDFVNSGGCGEVWTSRQERLNRVVAVKRLRRRGSYPGSDESAHESVRRSAFLREAAITAHLEHPNIVPVYDLGRAADGAPVIAMKLIRGKSWQQILNADFPEMPPDAFLMKHLPIFLQTMQAVAFAHSRKIVHRDLKPSQVMVGEFGEVLLMDWGLAVSEAEIADPGRPTLARGGFGDERTPDVVAAAGTPALMAPEQTSGQLGSISIRTDIYLLGGVLYFLLTGTFPHVGRDSAEAIRMASAGHVQPPSERAPGRDLPPDLVALCLRCLSPNPADRPAGVAEVIQAVEDHFTGATGRRESERLLTEAEDTVSPVELLVGTPVDVTGRAGIQVDSEDYSRVHEAVVHALNLVDQAARHWSRNPRLGLVRDRVNTVYARLAVLGGDLRLGRYLADRLENRAVRSAIQRALERRERALADEHRSRRFAIAACLMLTVLFALGGARYTMDQRAAGVRLALERDQADAARRRAEEEQYFAGIGLARSRVREGKFEDARAMLLGGLPEWPRQWEWGRLMAESSLDVMTLVEGEPPGGVYDGMFAPDGATIATGDSSGAVVLWEAGTGRARISATPHSGPIWCVRYSPDGKQILAASFDRTASILDAETLELQKRLNGPTDVMRGAAWRPDGRQVAGTSRDGVLRFWNTETGELEFEGIPRQSGFYDVDYSPDGTRVAAGGYTKAGIYDTATGRLVLAINDLPENLLSIRYSPDGTRLLTACTDRIARVHDAQTGEILTELRNETSWLHMAEWSPDGSVIATADNAGAFRLWDPASGERLASYSTMPLLFKLAFSPDGTHLLTVSQSAAKLWDLRQLRDAASRLPISGRQALLTPVDNRLRFNYAPLDRASSWFLISQWNPPGGRTLLGMHGGVYAVDSWYTAISADGTRRAEIDRNSLEVSVIDTATEQPIACPDVRRCLFVGWSPKDDYLITGDENGEFVQWDTRKWQRVRRLGVPEGPPRQAGTQAQGLAVFTPDGRSVAVGTRSGYVTLYNLSTGDEIWQARPDNSNVLCMGFDAAGTMLAVGSVSQRATVHDLRTGALLSTIRGHTGGITSVSFTPDSRRLMTTSVDDTARLWDPRTGREVMVVLEDTSRAALMGAAFTEDGRHAWAIMDNGSALFMEAFRDLPQQLAKQSTLSLPDRVELYKRRLRTGLPVVPEDIAVRRVGVPARTPSP